MKTRLLAVLLCAVLALTLSACGVKDKDTSETTGTSSVTETENTGGTDSDQKQTTDKPTETTKTPETAKPTGNNNSGKSQTGGNTSETSKPSGGNTSGGQQSGGKQEETTSTTEPEDNDNEGEIVIPSGGIELPIVKP